MTSRPIRKQSSRWINQHRLPCENCAGTTNHATRRSIDKTDANPDSDIQTWERFQIIECLGCGRLSFRHELTSSEDLEFDEDGNASAEIHSELYPARLVGLKPLQHYYYLPSKVRRIYSEAHFALRNQQRILAAIGIRALVEAVCGEEKARGRNLAQRIDSLVGMGKLTGEGASILHGTRLLGNDAAHEVAPPTADDLRTAMQVAEHLLTAVYILPKVAVRLPKPDPATKGGR